MSDSPPDYQAFRRRLDDVLRQRNPEVLRAFLIAEGQWTEATATDPESAMWMMIATSPALTNQRDEARQWLLTHGHEAEAQAIFSAQRTRGNSRKGGGHPTRRGKVGNTGKPASQPAGTGKSGKPSSRPERRDHRRP